MADALECGIGREVVRLTALEVQRWAALWLI